MNLNEWNEWMNEGKKERRKERIRDVMQIFPRFDPIKNLFWIILILVEKYRNKILLQ